MGSSVAARGRRPSLGERERFARTLRAAYEDGRLSVDTFVERLDLAYSVRSRAELRALIADLATLDKLSRAALAATEWTSRWTHRLAAAWERPRVLRLVLPTSDSIVLGRARDCDCVLSDPTVSRRHALLTYRGGVWRLRDLASCNGTYLNGARVIDEAEVQPGDDMWFGMAHYELVAPHTRPTVG